MTQFGKNPYKTRFQLSCKLHDKVCSFKKKQVQKASHTKKIAEKNLDDSQDSITTDRLYI